MKLLTQDDAKEHLKRMNTLTSLSELSQLQAIEAIELLDDLQYSYHVMASKQEDVSEREKIYAAAKGVRDTMYQMADDYDICSACYQPGYVCRCGCEHDDWWNDEDKWTAQDDINCWLD